MSEDSRRRTSRRAASSAHNSKAFGKRKEMSTTVAVDFVKLDMNSLLRYAQSFDLKTRPNCTKSELLVAVKKHFAQYPTTNEAEIVSQFLCANQLYLDENHE